MKRLPEIHLNGNITAWVTFFAFLGSVIAVSVTAGLWIGGVNMTTGSVTKLTKQVDSLATSTIQVATQVKELTRSVTGLAVTVDGLSAQVGGVQEDTARIRGAVGGMATRAWVLSLRAQADTDHAQLRRAVDAMKQNTERLEQVEEDLRGRVDRLEHVSNKLKRK